MNYDKIGKFIAFLRKKKGLTQKDLANSLNITDRAVSKWERGKGCPDVSLLEELSKILDVSIIELLKGEKTNNKQKIEKEELLYSMNYVKNSGREKILKIINTVVITLVMLIILIIIFNNLKISILFNYHYYPNIEFIDNINLFEDMDNKINLLKTRDVNYSEEELDEIISIIEKYKDIDKKIYNKEYYTYDDMKNILYKDEMDDFNEILKLSIYNIYNSDIDWNGDIDYFVNSYYENKRGIKEFIDNGYKYNYRYSLDDDIGNKVRNLFYDKYYIYSLILSDILNGGEVNE